MEWNQIAVIVSLVTAVNGGFVWAVRWMLTNDRKRIMQDLADVRTQATEQNDKHEKLREQFAKLREQMPKEYVRREDWIISFGRVEQKIDAIWAFIHKFCQGRV